MGQNILLHASPAPLDSAFLISAFFIIYTRILRSFTHFLWSFRHAFPGYLHINSVVYYTRILRLFRHAFSGHSHAFYKRILKSFTHTFSWYSRTSFTRFLRSFTHSQVFKFFGPVTWNSLPLSARHLSSLYSIKSKLNVHFFFLFFCIRICSFFSFSPTRH